MNRSSCDGCASRDEGCSSGTCGEVRLPPGILSEYNITDDVTDGVMIIIESSDPDPISISAGLIGKAKDLNMGRIFAVLFGDASKKDLYTGLFEYGVDTIYHIRSPILNEFNAERYASSTTDVIRRVRPSLVLTSATVNGIEFMNRIATDMRTDVIDCKGPCEHLTAGISTRTSIPKFITVQPGTFPTPDPQTGRKGTAINIPYSE